MRFAVVTLIAIVGLRLAPSAIAAEAPGGGEPAKIVRVWTDYRDEPSFVRIGAMRDAASEPGHPIVLRTDPQKRGGFYFTVRVRSGGDGAQLEDGQIRLLVVAPDAALARTYTFPVKAGKARNVLLDIGLTGADWTYGDLMPLAWRIEVVDAAGELIAFRNSFLWDKPAPGNS